MSQNCIVKYGFICLFASWVPAAAQISIPGIQSDLQPAATTLGVAYLERLVLNSCSKMFPHITQFETASEALGKISAELEKSLPKQAADAVWEYVANRYEKMEPMLTMNTQAFYECSQASRLVAAQIQSGTFSSNNK